MARLDDGDESRWCWRSTLLMRWFRAGSWPLPRRPVDLSTSTSAIHVLTVGTVTTMMLAVMTRATRGHTGRELTASATTGLSYASIFLCALVRPLAGVLPEQASMIYAASAILWMSGFLLFLGEFGPMLVARRKPAARAG
jgi:uncharacterized protein involved in response to NO